MATTRTWYTLARFHFQAIDCNASHPTVLQLLAEAISTYCPTAKIWTMISSSVQSTLRLWDSGPLCDCEWAIKNAKNQSAHIWSVFPNCLITLASKRSALSVLQATALWWNGRQWERRGGGGAGGRNGEMDGGRKGGRKGGREGPLFLCCYDLRQIVCCFVSSNLV